MRGLLPLALGLALVIGWLSLGVAPAVAQSPLVLDGRVTNGTPGEAAPSGLEVSLTIFDGEDLLQQLSTITDDEGAFRFSDVPSGPGLRYAVGIEYLGALYQADADPNGETPLEMTVYETTTEAAGIAILDDTLMVTPDEEEQGVLLVREVARIRNSQLLTFIPSFQQETEAGMTLLRFSLPFGYRDLTIRSDLIGGQVIPVDRGVGITAAVPPGVHAMVFTYALPYEGTNLVYEPSFPFGVQALRVLMREDAGTAVGSDLEQLESITVGGQTFRVFQVSNLAPGERITLGFSDLPREPWTQRVWDAISGRWEVSLVIPGLAGLLLLALLLYAWRLRLRKAEFIAPAVLVGNIQRQPAQRRWLEAIARLDESFQQGEVPREEYTTRREELKRTLLSLAIKDARSL